MLRETQARQHLIRNHFRIDRFENLDQGAVRGCCNLHRDFVCLELHQRFILDDRFAHLLAPAQNSGAGSFLVGRY
jgi:hypothetical protein